jgi:transposase
MSVRTARTWERGSLPSETKRARGWRTRRDPFAGVWAQEIEPWLRADREGVLEARTLFERLLERHPGEFAPGQLRTLQRRVREWRGLHGPQRDVVFPQAHAPGREAQLDFTHARELGVTIGGEPLDHLLFEFVLSYSGWRYVEVAFGETYEALVAGLQGALWTLGAVPEVARSDNLSAATHELRRSGGRALSTRFAAVLAHYGMRSTRISPGCAQENGVAEQAHRRTKSALAQALVLRGSRDFESLEAYRAFVAAVIEPTNRRVAARLAEERPQLRPLPPQPLPAYSSYPVVVRRWSTIRVAGRTYSVPSRLIGHEVQARLYAERLEVWYAGRCVEAFARLRAEREHRIDYRHVIWSLVRKPGAFARYRFREELFPTLVFRHAYDALRCWRGERADVEYVRVLHLAASTLESTVERALAALLEAGEPFDYARVRELAAPARPELPALATPQAPDLGIYDALLSRRLR